MNIEIVSSKDGSHTLLIPSMNETYHSMHGALTESLHVFIKEGLDFIRPGKTALNIFEVGYGTGLNAILTLQKAEEIGVEIQYKTLEPYPIDPEILNKLNYKHLLGEKMAEYYDNISVAEWEQFISVSKYFSIYKCKESLENCAIITDYDLVYFDAFAPSKQPDVWKIDNLSKCYDLLREGGALVTYCAQGQFKRDLKAVGFTVQTLEGPPGKKEMTRAIKS